MAYSEDDIALAAEYALGTLDAGERAQVESKMSADAGFAAIVDAWERKLGVLNQMVGLVEPRAEVWGRIKSAAGLSGQQAPIVLPQSAAVESAARTPDEDAAVRSGEAVAAEPAANEFAANEPAASERAASERAANDAAADARAADVAGSNVVDFSAATRRWRGIAGVTSSIAAALVAFIVVQAYRPEALPSGLRPRPEVRIVQAKAPAATPSATQGQFVALLQKDPASPAFILTVDGASKNFTVRQVGATPQPGKSYELWLVSDRLQRPRSLGLIGANEFTTSPSLTAYDPDMVSKATYAVTVEPEGGAPGGVATGPIVFTGKLIEAVPAKQ